ncbi:lysine--tRNA ligase [Candidatus Nesciobacter abundans]|uniref:Lysine--tRNA ligase n=1 Tax=Candidatus Nesciobacter abundans TaxID=2601668 RepID=A0A5C0UG44_9PROT|nr:lysine--tRNA ligase [Candidatus Nesciobacter abundans]QEK39076.1 lysine--tRNA ligase [Candidatus Nesciobacter abundans]
MNISNLSMNKNLPRTWAMKCAQKLLKRDFIILETGYGPSGLPHLGTVAEVIRTRMIQNCLDILGKESKIIVFVDDMDGFRKVPTNLPNQDMLANYLHLPLCKVPDPFGCCESYADHNTNELIKLLKTFGLEDKVEIMKSSDKYNSGEFDENLVQVLNNYEKILNVMLPTLGEARQKTYSPFLPISQKNGHVLEVKIEKYLKEEKSICFYDQGELVKMPVTGGNCKLQWKVDWGMRWAALGVDFEMYGKDLIDSYSVSKQICTILGSRAPNNMVYELFLDSEGKKISKSKGNGISLEEWLNYATEDSVKHFLFLNPDRAKNLDKKDLHKYVDNYLSDLEKYRNSISNSDLHSNFALDNHPNHPSFALDNHPSSALDNSSRKDFVLNEHDYRNITENPVFYVHEGVVPPVSRVSYSMILNLAKGLRSPDFLTFKNFIENKIGKLNITEDKVVESVFKFYESYKTKPSETPEWIKSYMKVFLEKLDSLESGNDMQQELYLLGNKAVFNNDVADLKSWFKAIYGILFGEESGPRLGPFFELYGKDEARKMIESII